MRTYGFIVGILFLGGISLSVFAVTDSEERRVLRSSVASEFRNGLHEKYLLFLADKLGLELKIIPMKFGRRLLMLKEGEIDLILGVKAGYQDDGFVYLSPSYEKVRNSYFVSRKSKERLTTESDIALIKLGVTTDINYLSVFKEDMLDSLVPLGTLRQKIEMLEKGRIQAFVHFHDSAVKTISEMHLEDKILVSDFQMEPWREYFILMSRKSPLFDLKPKVETVIRNAVASGDFSRIREAHYQANP